MSAKNLVRVFGLVTIVSSSTAVCAQQRHDGHLWRSLSKELKVAYIQGLLDGSAFGAEMAKEGFPANTPCSESVLPAYRKTAVRLIVDVSPEQISDGVDTIFKDFRNRSLLITDAVYVTLQAIAGRPAGEIEKLLQAVRSAPR